MKMKKLIITLVATTTFLTSAAPAPVLADECNHQWGAWEVWSEPTCIEEGIETRECQICFETEERQIPTIDHSWENWQTTKKATIFSEGSKQRECSGCWKVEVKTIPKLKMTSAQKKIQSTMKTFFSGAKKYNTSKIKGCFSNPNTLKLFTTNKYMVKYLQNNNKYTSYQLKSISVKGNTATVKASVKYFNSYYVYYSAFGDVVNYLLVNPNASDAAAHKVLYNSCMKYYRLNRYPANLDYTQKTISFKFRKNGGKWKITTFSSAIKNLLHLNYEEAYGDYFG